MTIFILLLIESVVLYISYGKDITIITPWLIGINFTFSLFAINLTFFGYQLAKYKPIYERISKRQWFNLYLITLFPFIPLCIYIVCPSYFSHSALYLMPIILFSAFDNANLTFNYLNPIRYINTKFTKKNINNYIFTIRSELLLEIKKHNEYLNNLKNFQIPMHEWQFNSEINGTSQSDLWDAISTLIKQSVLNGDISVFSLSVNKLHSLLESCFAYHNSADKTYEIRIGIQSIGKKRSDGLSNWIFQNDKEGIFIQEWLSIFCRKLDSLQKISYPLSDYPTFIIHHITNKAQYQLDNKLQFHRKIIKSIHAYLEFSILTIYSENYKFETKPVDVHNIAELIFYLKNIGITALKNEKVELVYRCMETISFLGCNAASISARQSICNCISSLVQIGRVSRKMKIHCFWDHCSIPIHKHAEEFIGHILTWLIKDIKPDLSFTLKSCAETAYSRIRGYKCKIVPKQGLNPAFWINEIVDQEGKKIEYVEELLGSSGYSGFVNYADIEELKENRLYAHD